LCNRSRCRSSAASRAINLRIAQAALTSAADFAKRQHTSVFALPLPLSSNLRHLCTPAGRVGIYGKLSFRRRKFARARVDYLSVTRETRAMRRTRVKYLTRDCDLVAVVHSAKRNSRERVSSSRLPSGRTEADE